MSPELEKKLFENHPRLLGSGVDGQYPRGIWGVETLDGWYELIDTLCHAIQHRVDSTSQPQVTISQIKEKFAELRFYIREGDEHIQGMIAIAEAMCGKICEECGCPGARKSVNGWQIVRCEQHTPTG